MEKLIDDKMRDMLKDMPVREGVYFITGATGFIGSYIVLSLLYLCKYENMNIKVIVAVRNQQKAKNIYRDYLHEKYFELVIHDMTEDYSIEENIDYIIHAAARKHMSCGDAYNVFIENILSTKSVLAFASEKRVQKILLVSTCSVYGDLLFEGITAEDHLGGNESMNAELCYAESKRASEYMFAAGLKQLSLFGNVVRLFSVYGVGMDISSPNVFSDLFRQALSRDEIVIKGTGESIRNFSYISDVIYGIFTVMYSGENGKAYNVGSKNANCSILGLAEKMKEKSRRKIQIRVNNQQTQIKKETMQSPQFELIESLKIQPETSLDEGLDKMFLFYADDKWEDSDMSRHNICFM